MSSQLLEKALVPERTFNIVMWTGFGLAITCIIIRMLIRVKTLRKLDYDDGFVLLAGTGLLINVIIWSQVVDDMYTQNAVSSGQVLPPANFIEISEKFLRACVGIIILFYTSIWSVKLSFLMFFRRLYTNVPRIKYHWWAVLIFVVGSWIACIGLIQYDCLTPPLMEMMKNCPKQSSIDFQRNTLVANCVLDLATDVAIMSIPFAALWSVQMNIRRKAALGVVFSVTVITMAFAITRVTIVDLGTASTKVPDTAWLYMWSNIEESVAIVVACLATFRTIFVSKNSKQTPRRYTPSPESSGTPRRKMQNITDLISSIVAMETEVDVNDDVVRLTSIDSVPSKPELHVIESMQSRSDSLA